MGLHKLTAGDGYTYLTRQVAVHDATDRGHSGLGDYYSEKGESPGRWWGAGLDALHLRPGDEVTEQQMRNLFGEGRHPDAEQIEDAALDAGATAIGAEKASRLGRLFAVHSGAPEFAREVARRFTEHNYAQGSHWKTPVPAAVRAQIRTQVAEEMFAAEHGRAPVDDRERAGFLARASRQKTTAVAGFDLAFTPVKSVSTLWALAEPELVVQVEEAHHAAVEKTLAYLEREVLFTRRGRGGVQQVKARGLVATLFTHRDARSGDPNLHSHVAISNKVQDADGRWLSVDGRVLYKAKVTLSETYNTLIEAELVGRLGVQFAARGDAAEGKREVREIVGIDPRLQQAWSSRSTAIEGRRRELAVDFQATHGRPPTPVESLALAQQATLETRQAKHSPRSEAEQRAAWHREAVGVLGSAEAINSMLTATLSEAPTRQRVTVSWVEATAAGVVEAVQASRATWQVWHLRSEAQRRVRAAGISLSDNAEAVNRVVDRAIEHHCITFADPDPITEPTALTRPDGTSVYTLHGSRLFTARAIVNAEQQLLAAAHKTGGRQVSEVRVGIALAEAAANGTVLNAAQGAMVRELATSGAHLQLTLAPAGAGKTTALEVLARAWRDTGGTVVGLAPSAVAAQQLREAVGGTTDTLAKLVWSLDPDHATPEWVAAIDAQTLVVIDEAGMAGTVELAQAVDFVLARGGSVRLVGDDRQLAAVAAGGILRDIATTVGAVTLTEVRRFTDPAEAAATLTVREGDTSALGFYADRGRIHVGDLASAADQAYTRWAADVAAGRRSILLAPTRELVAELNTRARTDRLNAHPRAASAPSISLSDGTRASAGDTIVTRRNDRTLRISATDWVKNGDRWTIQAVHPDGSVTALHELLRRTVRLPRDYVEAGHVQLGYASTIHGAQGITVDTSHTVLTGNEDRSLLYVATSRGRTSNDIYLAVGTDGDPHTVIHPDTLLPPTALDQLAAILGRDAAPVSATTAARAAVDPATLLRDAAVRYHDALTFAAEHLLGPDAMDRLDQAGDLLHAGLTEAPAWPTLRSHLALRALDGQDPITLLNTAISTAPLADALDAAAVIDTRIGPSNISGNSAGPLPWLPPIPTQLAEDLDWGGYLTARADRVTELTAQVEGISRNWSPETAPAWAHPLLHPADAALRARLAVWRAAHDIPEADARPTGPPQIGNPGEHQRTLNRAVRAARPSDPFTHRTWYSVLPDTVRADPWITPLCQQLARLESAGLNVGDYLNKALATDRPLPDEHAAAALWWRLVGHLGPAAIHGDTHTAAHLQASWLPDLVTLFGTEQVEMLQHSPPWPALVAAVDAATRHGWTPEQLLATATGGLPDDLRPEEICDALVLRIAVLTDPPEDLEGSAPPPHEDDFPPEDLHETEAPSWINDASLGPQTAGRQRSAPAAASESSALGRERIVELHEAALDYYRDCYPRSWAPDYLRERLHTDLSDHPHHVVGYAPPGPTSLIRHLTTLGATIEELEAAGLVRRRDRGDLADAFRDRLILPIRDTDGATIGFVGRRNPTKTDDDYAGPKYLNTRSTAAFTKGEALFGLTEGRAALQRGATPVLVEGPLDALAITIATEGAAVGIAPLGTALTTSQVGLLHPYFCDDPTRIVLATDADAPGWKAAQSAYWNLTAAGADPTVLAIPDGLDPAQLLQDRGTTALQDAITNRRALATDMINHHLAAADDWTNPATRLRLVRLAGRIIAARPPQTWADAIEQLTQRLHLSPGVLHLEVIDQNQNRADDLAQFTHARIQEIGAQNPARRISWRFPPTGTFPVPQHSSTPEGLHAPTRSARRGSRPNR